MPNGNPESRGTPLSVYGQIDGKCERICNPEEALIALGTQAEKDARTLGCNFTELRADVECSGPKKTILGKACGLTATFTPIIDGEPTPTGLRIYANFDQDYNPIAPGSNN